MQRKCCFISVVGIIAEFNPLHSGHKYIIDCAKQNGNTVICVISGNFVQRGDTAVIPKQKRVETAIKCGADIVAELPVIWSMSTAQNFALGGVWQLYTLGCDEILFGSECGDIKKLTDCADILLSDKFALLVSNEVKKGVTFATARETVAVSLGVEKNLLSSANDNLGIEYIIASKKLNLPIKFKCVKRIGANHNSNDEKNGFVSSSLLRQKILSGDIGYAEKFMPISARGIINEDIISDIKRIEIAVLTTLRQKNENYFKNIADVSEGLENKIYFSIRVATSLEELYNMVKSKRYTLARIRRMVLSSFLGIEKDLFMTAPPYVRVLGFSKNGCDYLSKLCAISPVVLKVSEIKQLDEKAQKVFATECKATDLYSLSLKKPQECGIEYKTKLLKTEDFL
ncbi:MAG: nucleotidyltransferase family protein [Clostridia bacterium]|nr:nucleotidyltransferase family protein [Clostridia bacterium]